MKDKKSSILKEQSVNRDSHRQQKKTISHRRSYCNNKTRRCCRSYQPENMKELLEIMPSKHRDNRPIEKRYEYPRITGGCLITK